LKFCSFELQGFLDIRLGMLMNDSGVVDLSASKLPAFSSLNSLIAEADTSARDLEGVIAEDLKDIDSLPKYSVDQFRLKIPFVPPEIWGAGITYMRSRNAREVETSLKGLYTYVYGAVRPEIFFKTTGLRCVGPDEEVSIRSDSKWSVPEPELTLVLGSECKVFGYTIGNDMSARDIEGENPLYLPQAKIFKRSCAIGPFVTSKEEIPDPKNLGIRMTISRHGNAAFEGRVSTSNLKRSLEELLHYLGRDNIVPPGSAFLTGTGIVPPDDFSLRDRDVIEIEIEKIGTLRNVARQL